MPNGGVSADTAAHDSDHESMVSNPVQGPDAVDAAIARVLDAERDARESVAQAGATAEAMLEAARSSVRALNARTERRIRGVRAAFEEGATREIAALDATAAEVGHERALGAAELARIDAAVEALAANLTESGP